MREIKFRAWHSGAKQMLQSRDQGHQGEVFKWLHEGQPVSIMQFTGLRDKNGKDICEGDVVNLLADAGAFKGGVTETLASVEWDAEDTGFYYLTQADNFPHVKPWFAVSVEVIGNIYENPSLLEAK